MQLGEMDMEAAAKAAAGNWKHFECFCWHRRGDIPDAENWAIIYTHNRDSGLLDQSNADAIEEALERFTQGDNPNVVFESHWHWAVGHVDGMSIRVYRRGRITKAFKSYHALAQRLADYPLLDEEDYSRREYEATLGNLPDAAWRLKREYELPEGWEEWSIVGSPTTTARPSRTATIKAAIPAKISFALPLRPSVTVNRWPCETQPRRFQRRGFLPSAPHQFRCTYPGHHLHSNKEIDMVLMPGHKTNFQTLQDAFANGDVALMECQLTATGEEVAVICAANRQENGGVEFAPFAMLFNGNPYEMLNPPKPDGGFCQQGE